MNQTQECIDPDTHPDPITHAPGAHVLGTGIGAAVGGAVGIGGAIAAGAVTGTMAGPIGTVAGAAVGAVVGGLTGKYIAEDVNPTVEENFWRDNYATRPYAVDGTFDDFSPAYRYGWESYGQHKGARFEEVEIVLESRWQAVKGESQLQWSHAKKAVHDAWDRLAAKHKKS